MKALFRALAFGAGLSMAAAPALADAPAGANAQQEIIQRLKPTDLVDFIQKEGYRAQLAKDKSGQSYVKTAISGFNVVVWLYGCETAGCSSIQFAVYGKSNNVDVAFANEWNLKWRYTKMSVDKEGYFAFTMDVVLINGVSTANIQANLQLFENALNTLKK